MANVRKSLDYFPFSVDFFTDRKIRRLQRAYYEKGIIIYIYLITEIYRNNSYYIQWDSDYPEDIADALGGNFTPELVNEVVCDCADSFGLFDSGLFKIGILTSRGIQSRLLEIRERASKKEVDIGKLFPRFCLIGENIELPVFENQQSAISGINSDNNRNLPTITEKSEISGEYRLKKRKEKESKEKESKENNIPIPPELDFPEFITIWDKWVKYRKEKRNALKPSTIELQFEFLKKHKEDAVEIIKQSIGHGWTGLFEIDKRYEQKPTSTVSMTDRQKINEEFLNGK